MFGRCKILEPDQTADLARVYSFWHKHLIWAHMTELRLKGSWTIHLRNEGGYEARSVWEVWLWKELPISV